MRPSFTEQWLQILFLLGTFLFCSPSLISDTFNLEPSVVRAVLFDFVSLVQIQKLIRVYKLM